MVWVLNKYFTGEFLVSDFLSCLFLVLNMLIKMSKQCEVSYGCCDGQNWTFVRQEHYILELLELLSQPKLQRLGFFGPPRRPGQRCVGTISPGAAVPFCVPSNQPDHTLIGTTRTKEHNNHWTPLKITTKSVIIPWPTHALLSVSDRKGQNVKSHPNSFRSSDDLIKI